MQANESDRHDLLWHFMAELLRECRSYLRGGAGAVACLIYLSCRRVKAMRAVRPEVVQKEFSVELLLYQILCSSQWAEILPL